MYESEQYYIVKIVFSELNTTECIFYGGRVTSNGFSFSITISPAENKLPLLQKSMNGMADMAFLLYLKIKMEEVFVCWERSFQKKGDYESEEIS